jgi:hypothetical protein
MEITKICPFRTQELIQGRCVSECQLFISGKTPQEGKCALSLLPAINAGLVAINQTITSIGRTMPTR